MSDLSDIMTMVNDKVAYWHSDNKKQMSCNNSSLTSKYETLKNDFKSIAFYSMMWSFFFKRKSAFPATKGYFYRSNHRSIGAGNNG